MSFSKLSSIVVVASALALGIAAQAASPSSLKATLNASGATFPKAFYEEAMAEFKGQAAGVTINYAGGGSGKGRQDLADQIVDFAGTDSPIKAEDMAKFKGGEVLYFPTVVAPITVSYNLAGVSDLKLGCPTVAKIFQGEITNWNDPAIAAENSGAKLPSQAITIAVRSDSSGTTDNFSKFLDKGCGSGGDGTWKKKTGSTIEWPAGATAGNGNSGVAQIVKSTQGAIGYVDLSDARASGLSFASVKNKDGRYMAPTVAAATAAAAGATVAADLTYSAVWASGPGAYPITAQTWIVAYKNQTDKAKGEALQAWLTYVLTDGQSLAPDVDFGPLPKDIASKAQKQVAQLHLPNN
jgi:phosphate transport system substrate-binding protein